MDKKLKHGPKSSEEIKLVIIQRLADFDKPREVVEYLKENHDFEISERQVYYYQKTYEEEILDERARLNKELLTIPIASKRYRLKMRQELIDDILKKGLWVVMGQTIVDDKIKNADGSESLKKRRVLRLKGNHGTINQALDSAQDEVEPQKHALTDPTGERESALIFIPDEEPRCSKGDCVGVMGREQECKCGYLREVCTTCKAVREYPHSAGCASKKKKRGVKKV